MHNCDCPFCDAGRSTFNVRRNPDEDEAPYRIKYFRASVPDPLYLGPYDTHEDALDKYMQLMSRKGVISAVIEPICEFCASPHCDPDAGWACDESVAGFDSDEFESLRRYRRNGGKESRRRRARECPDCGIQRSFFTSPTHPRGWYGYHGYCIICHSRRSNMGTCPKCPPPKVITYQLVCSCGRSTMGNTSLQTCPSCSEQMKIYDPKERQKYRKNPVPYSEASHGMCVDCFQGVLPARVLKSRNEELRAHGITVYCAWCKQIIYDPNIDHIYRRNPDKDYVFLGPCDRLRMAGNETKWQEMMHHKTPISAEEFGQACALKTLLEDDETLWDFVAGDPDSGFYTSIWGGQPCMFIQTHGFEFIFIPQ